MLKISDTDLENEFSEFKSELSDLTGYPEKFIDNLYKSALLYSIDTIADATIESDYKPGVVEFPIFPFGKLRFERNLRSKDTDTSFEFIPSESFYDMFYKAYFDGETPMLKIMRANFDIDLASLNRNNLLSLERLL